MPQKADQTYRFCGTDVHWKERTHKTRIGVRATQSGPDLKPLCNRCTAERRGTQREPRHTNHTKRTRLAAFVEGTCSGEKRKERTHKENYLGVTHKAGPTCNFSEKDDAQTPPHPPLPPPPTSTSDPHRPTYHNPRLAAFVEAICSEKQIAHKSAPRHTACCVTDEQRGPRGKRCLQPDKEFTMKSPGQQGPRAEDAFFAAAQGRWGQN